MTNQYIYDDSPIQSRDIVEALKSSGSEQYIKGNLYIVKSLLDDNLKTIVDEDGSTSNGWVSKNFRKIKTLNGTSHQKDNKVIYIGQNGKAIGSAIIGQVYTSHVDNPDHITWDKQDGRTRWATEFKVICIYNDINNNKNFIKSRSTIF